MAHNSSIIALSDLGNRRSPFRGIDLRISTAAVVKGTRWSRFIFMRTAGIVQVAHLRSISDHLAPIDSCVRAAVRMVNSKARADRLSRLRNCAMNAGSSE